MVFAGMGIVSLENSCDSLEGWGWGRRGTYDCIVKLEKQGGGGQI